jgi:hypothetical protein
MKKGLIVSLFIVIGLLGMIRSNQPVSSGEDFEMHVNVLNNFNKDLDGMKVRLFIPELGIMLHSGSFNLYDGEKQGRFIFWNNPDVPSGDYLVKIVASNDDRSDVKYRYISII